jgi:hypothetical protein
MEDTAKKPSLKSLWLRNAFPEQPLGTSLVKKSMSCHSEPHFLRRTLCVSLSEQRDAWLHSARLGKVILNEPLADAQIGMLDDRVCPQRSGGIGKADLAGLHHDALMSDLERAARVLLAQ